MMPWLFWALGATPKSQMEPPYRMPTHAKSAQPRDERVMKRSDLIVITRCVQGTPGSTHCAGERAGDQGIALP
jgi:hypothetical protein